MHTSGVAQTSNPSALIPPMGCADHELPPSAVARTVAVEFVDSSAQQWLVSGHDTAERACASGVTCHVCPPSVVTAIDPPHEMPASHANWNPPHWPCPTATPLSGSANATLAHSTLEQPERGGEIADRATQVCPLSPL